MSTIERLTKTHADLENELSHFGRMLADAGAEPQTKEAVAALTEELEAVHELLEHHIENETSLSERSDYVLGSGSMDDYGVLEHQSQLRAGVQRLRQALDQDSATEALAQQFAAFLEQFERYTDAELEFLRENAAVLFPGGSQG